MISGFKLHSSATVDELILQAILENQGDNLLYVRMYGHTPELSSGESQDVWDVPGTPNKTYLTSAETIDLVSTSADDTAAGTGARIVQIRGLDSDFNLSYENVTMSGLTPVTSSTTFIRVYRILVLVTGSTNKNQGDINSTATSSGSVEAWIQTGVSFSHATHFTIPAGYTALIEDLQLNLRSIQASTKEGNFSIEPRARILGAGDYTEYITNEFGVKDTGIGYIPIKADIPGILPPYTDYRLKFDAYSNATEGVVQYTLLLIKSEFTTNNILP